MRVVTQTRIDAPIEGAFQACADFDAHADRARARGIGVTRRALVSAPGAAWDVTFRARGRDRTMEVEVAAFTPPSGFTARAISGGLLGVITVGLTPVGQARTMMRIEIDVTAQRFPARILLQSLRLIRGRLQRRLATRTEAFARDVSAQWSVAAGPPPV